ncbi:hypothetical protein DL769_008488 [Monosporascus sp. CRB-8-3]|nr:hypothetical protein DL769_008488 [Monosporascus sp. CRB-8-3]
MQPGRVRSRHFYSGSGENTANGVILKSTGSIPVYGKSSTCSVPARSRGEILLSYPGPPSRTPATDQQADKDKNGNGASRDAKDRPLVQVRAGGRIILIPLDDIKPSTYVAGRRRRVESFKRPANSGRRGRRRGSEEENHAEDGVK